MNDTKQLLKQAAESEAKTYTDYVTSFTSAGIASLVRGGMSFEKAASAMKEACDSNPTLINLRANAIAFEKSAEYIEQLETTVTELQKQASATPAKTEVKEDNEPLNKLAAAGFSKEEIEMISQLPENLMTKVANVGSQPWEMGGGTGIPREKTDPVLEFILS